MKRKLLIVLFTFAIALDVTATASAHGAKIDYTINVAVEIRAAYDTGTPMAGGQVTVYAPDAPSTPWLEGVCDEDGRFTFTPDPAIPGTWDVQVRQAGHGDIIHIPVGEDAAMSGSSGGYSVSQIIVMAICVIWGIAGTALYFSRRRA